MQLKKFALQVGKKELKIEISRLAERTNASILARMGETVVLVTCVMAKKAREGYDFMPLSVDFEEKFYAAGKIKGSRFVKREGRPSDEAILTGRLIDRALRPLFDQRIRQEIQIVATVLSFDNENDPDIIALIAASLALSISDIPWSGPVAGLRIGMIDNELILNPDYSQREKSDFEVIVAGAEDKINMLEIKGKETPEEKILEAISFAQPYLKEITAWQKELQKEINEPKMELSFEGPSPEFVAEIKSFLNEHLEKAIFTGSQVNKLSGLKEELVYHLKANFSNEKINSEELKKLIQQAERILDEEIDRSIHENILKSDKRPDGRNLDEVRELICQVDILPRTHGSALFVRGTTQALAITTLGGPGDEQLFETMESEGKKHFMLHYNFPPFSVGETKPLRGPGRREIGHGALAEKSIEPMIPQKENFPYTIRLVSEILASNGSSSMASVCASSMSLMAAGVPMKEPVAGIAMGLILGENKSTYKILTDIQGPEDHHGDMDLKVAGTNNGITGAQMDVKIEGLNIEILSAAFKQAKKARLEILSKMKEAIDKPRPDLSPFAPRVYTLQINPEKIRDVIGAGGKIINKIIDETGVEIDIEDSGLIFITAPDKESSEKAISWIEILTREAKPGEIFQGKVIRILDFGAMVEILPEQTGLIHISELAPYRVNKVSDVVKIGDTVTVKVKNIDELGRINLSLKDAQADKNS
ncbi:MAG: Polyribonucleotide nucleotidyltransferase [Parcubacteria group bacterium GW2011_GWF2_39_13b]|nr:MAG: Polyribonucleotide nucleotidyltransferase [Parcubacteria group bacterium GW2011_GWF2_39_13b]